MTTTLTPSSAEAAAALSARGVRTAARLVSDAGPALALAWCKYADHRSLAPGAIVGGIRSGRLPPAPKPSLVEEQKAYGESIARWLQRNFPEFGAHTAAGTEVIRLHWLHGKGSLTRAEHGDQIREAVHKFERKWSEETAT